MCGGAVGARRHTSGAKARFCGYFDAWAKAQAYLRSNSKSKSNNHHEWVKEKGTRVAALPSKMRGFFPIRLAQDQNDDVKLTTAEAKAVPGLGGGVGREAGFSAPMLTKA